MLEHLLITPILLSNLKHFTSSENQDPVSLVMGPAYAQIDTSDNALLKAHEDLRKAQADSAENVDELDSKFRLMVLLNQIDLQLMQSSVVKIAK